ncbi:MAG: putative ABC transporter permease subunit [Gemmatimonadales bacterium]
MSAGTAVVGRQAGISRRQAGIIRLLEPKWRSALARVRREQTASLPRLLLLGVLGLAFWAAAFGILYKVLSYFRGVEEIGSLLAGKILSVALLAFLLILLLSNIITALSTFFLAKDLDLVVAAPLDWLTFYLAKLTETALHSSWMVGLLAVPLLTAYGVVYDGGPLFPVVALAAIIPFALIPAAIGTAITLLLVNLVQARRARDLLSLVALGAGIVLVVLLRVIQPEQLARPEGFRDLLDFITLLRSPTHPLLPSEWASRMVMNWLQRVADPLPVLLLWSTAGAMAVFGALLHRRLYASGFSRALEGAGRPGRRSRWQAVAHRLFGWMPASRREFLLKDLRVFFRDTTQWSQLILLGVIVLVFIFNVRALPLYTGERVPTFLITFIVFLNQALAGFVLAGVAARLVFPALSLEGRQMWLLRSSPLDLRAMLWSKYWIGTIPLLVLALGIAFTTSVMLQASPFVMALNVGTITLLTLALSSMALAFGAFFPQFETENAAQIATSFGGLLYMMASVGLLGLVIAIEAWPVVDHLRRMYLGGDGVPAAKLALPLALVAALCLVATLLPLKLAIARIESTDF